MTPDEASALQRTAEGHLRFGRYPQAIAAFRALLAADPARPDAWFNLGWLERQDRQFEAALASYAQAIAHGLAGAEEAHVNRAVILAEHQDRIDDARIELDRALSLRPDYVPALLNLGGLEEDLGALAAARDAYGRVLEAAPGNGRATARLTMLDIADNALDRAAERLAKSQAATLEDRAEIGFAQALLLDASGDHEQAFPALLAANDQARALAGPAFAYDAAAQERLIDELIEAFPAALPLDPKSLGPEPLFICGMFRSGSTLCETVIARHPRVTMGGELEFIPAIVAGQPDYPHALGDLEKSRQDYTAQLAARFPEAQIVTDKRPDNFLHIGLIKSMFPQARIVHTVRDPRDTALSILFLWFQDGVRYGSRLEDIAHYMRCYRRLMAHWGHIFGDDIVTFDYDRFVAEPEPHARALFAALGLEWSDACSPRPAEGLTVRTPSAWAVRQPVHTRSSGRWRHYEAALAPFVAALEA